MLTPAGDGVWVQAEELAENGIAATSQLDRFQTGEQAALLLVEQAVKEQDGCFEFFGRHLKNGSIGDQRDRLGGLPGAKLIARLPAIGRGIQESPGYRRAAKTFCAHQIVERVLDFGMEHIGQLVGKPTARREIDEGLDGGDESAVARKPNGIVGLSAGFEVLVMPGAETVREMERPTKDSSMDTSV